jgi:hypothetical protein
MTTKCVFTGGRTSRFWMCRTYWRPFEIKLLKYNSLLI